MQGSLYKKVSGILPPGKIVRRSGSGFGLGLALELGLGSNFPRRKLVGFGISYARM